MRVRAITGDHVRSRAITCDYVRLRAITCGHVRSRAITCDVITCDYVAAMRTGVMCLRRIVTADDPDKSAVNSNRVTEVVTPKQTHTPAVSTSEDLGECDTQESKEDSVQ